MKVNKDEKGLLLSALETELARLKRAANAQKSEGIRELLAVEVVAVQALIGRVSQEPV